MHPELSYAIIGALLAVYKELGPGLPEKVYQRAVAEELRRRGVKFREQVSVRLFYKDLLQTNAKDLHIYSHSQDWPDNPEYEVNLFFQNLITTGIPG